MEVIIMNKMITLILCMTILVTLAGCAISPDKARDIPELSEIANYTEEQLDEKLIGLSEDELRQSWGEPDGMLSGFWGDIWNISDESNKKITIYFNQDGGAENIIVTEEDNQ